MKRFRTIVVEDERLPRMTLLAKLEDFRQSIEVIDDCDSYDSARDSILRNKPDLLFLDIQLQGRDSIQLLKELRETIRLPYVIFTTAYSDKQYLMSAIKLSAVDYLLKPIGKAELSHAIAKVAGRASENGASGAAAQEKLSFRLVNSKLFVDPEEIAWFKAEGNYSTIMTFGGHELILENMLSLERRLPAGTFARIDRSTIVNYRKVYKLNQQERSCTLRSDDGRELELRLSRSGTEALLAIL